MLRPLAGAVPPVRYATITSPGSSRAPSLRFTGALRLTALGKEEALEAAAELVRLDPESPFAVGVVSCVELLGAIRSGGRCSRRIVASVTGGRAWSRAGPVRGVRYDRLRDAGTGVVRRADGRRRLVSARTDDSKM